MSIEKDFVPYEESLELKALEFDKPCFGFYERGKELVIQECEIRDFHFDSLQCVAPTFSQAFRFFREKYDLDHYVDRNDDIMIKHVKSKGLKNLPKYACGYSDGSGHPIKSCDSYEEAELACLRKLIKITQESNNA